MRRYLKRGYGMPRKKKQEDDISDISDQELSETVELEESTDEDSLEKTDGNE